MQGRTFGHIVGYVQERTFGHVVGYVQGRTFGHVVGCMHGQAVGHSAREARTHKNVCFVCLVQHILFDAYVRVECRLVCMF